MIWAAESNCVESAEQDRRNVSWMAVLTVPPTLRRSVGGTVNPVKHFLYTVQQNRECRR